MTLTLPLFSRKSHLEEDGFSDDEVDDNKSEDESEGDFKDDWNLNEDGTLITGRQEGVNVIEDLKNICYFEQVMTVSDLFKPLGILLKRIHCPRYYMPHSCSLLTSHPASLNLQV